MKILLINENATVEKLVRLSAQRIGLELLAATIATDANAGEYAWVLVDNESLGGANVADLRKKYPSAKIGLLYPKNANRAEGYDLYIEKPFLPTELIDEFSSKDERKSGGADEELPEELPSMDDADIFGGDELKLDGADELDALAPIAEDQSIDFAARTDAIDSGDELNFDLGDLSTFDAPAPIEEVAADKSAETKSAVLDAQEVSEVKELLSEINDPPLQTKNAEFSFDDEFNGAPAEKETGSEEELKLELGENSALLDDEDLAELRQDGAKKSESLPVKEDSISELDALELNLDDSSATQAEDKKPRMTFGEIPPKPTETPTLNENAPNLEVDFDDSVTRIDEDLNEIDEAEVAQALGEVVPIAEKELADDRLDVLSADDGDPKELSEAPTISFDEKPYIEEIGDKSAADASAKALEHVLAALPPKSLRELLNGMQLTINISFPKKQ
ncbi:MAG: hypothetical protein LBI57_04505 [Helicobacteraceae bacterium]|jgi:uncharacterized membrane protein|nr:hypothetical protein [Helicobacteraceae bacterium]